MGQLQYVTWFDNLAMSTGYLVLWCAALALTLWAATTLKDLWGRR